MRATYRLQLSPELDFAAVRELVPYFRDLGISHLYLSPSLQARAGSTHGYDVVDPTRVSDTLGGEDGLRALRDAGLPIVLDIVPNHMGVSDENRWWADEELRAKVFDYDPQDGWYRRFFDIDDLAAVRVEDEEVFRLTHEKILELVRDGVVDGLRVDHPDGLADPAGYLRRLADAGSRHVWVEKILHPGERLRDWPVEGTVGYEFLNDAAALFVDPAGEGELTDVFAQLTGETRPFREVALEAQIQQATTTFAREVARLRSLLDEPGIADALAALPIYRTYVEPWSGRVEPEDRAAIEEGGIEGRLAEVLLLREGGHDEFVTRFQQTSPPVTAKGVEDTAFYRYVRLLALNEVGGDPGRFGLSVADFHAANAQRAERFPRGLLVTQTHDTKRSGDVRARIGALSGMASEWRERVLRWREVNAELRADGAPDANEEYLIYQTLVGAWPIEAERLEAYIEKALREAKRNTSWVEQDQDWEARVKRFAVALLSHEPFLDDFEPFAERVALEGRRSALGQLLLKLTAPGVGDIYQGDELEALNLVDPDNRRPVDWAARRAALDALRRGGAPSPTTMKLYTIWKALDLRARRPSAFAGSYEPLEAGPGVAAYLRGGEVLVVVPVRGWEDATMSGVAGRWRDVLGGGERDLADTAGVPELVAPHGLALLERLD
ncbi:MAG: (1-_4)-alpha-D-glucan 1-alpha-D-glucosylmutase [Solirubrobacteraceae bacterium]|nr:(1->4)-alpha-D-glucan 1-alpha-D-glucosylmutase [Solirubrobacteraceae bacterium]